MSLTIQFQTMVAMIIMGMGTGISLDTYTRFLKRAKKPKWFVFSNDILFWLLQGLLIFYVLLLVNEGTIRFYIFLALLCGYAAYQSLLRTLYLKILEMIISTIVQIYNIFRRLITIFIIRPIKGLIHIIIAVLLFLLHFILSTLIFILKIFYVPCKWLISLIWKIVPNNVKNFFTKAAGIFNRVKNILLMWMKRLRR